MFTTIYARFFLKEPIVPSDILNLFLVFAGIIFIVKPPFIFGYSKMYNEDPEALYAIIALLFGNVFLWAPTFIILRKLKGKKSSKYLDDICLFVSKIVLTYCEKKLF